MRRRRIAADLPFQRMYLSLVSPAVGIVHKFSSYRVMPDILPFLRVRFAAAHEVIEELALPGKGGQNAGANPHGGHALPVPEEP